MWNLDPDRIAAAASAAQSQAADTKRFPPRPEKDLIWFIEEYSPTLEDWHQRIIRELDLTSDETIEFAKLNSSVVQPSRHTLNPYYLGLKIFEVRELDSDISFIRNYLTKDLVNDLDLYIFEKKGPEWRITDKSWEKIRDQSFV